MISAVEDVSAVVGRGLLLVPWPECLQLSATLPHWVQYGTTMNCGHQMDWLLSKTRKTIWCWPCGPTIQPEMQLVECRTPPQPKTPEGHVDTTTTTMKYCIPKHLLL